MSETLLIARRSFRPGGTKGGLKLTVSVSDRGHAAGALGVDPIDGQIRHVYFLDTPDLMLNKNGLVIRARRVQQKGDDSVVRATPSRPE